MNRRDRVKRYLAMLLAFAMIFQQAGITTIADETEAVVAQQSEAAETKVQAKCAGDKRAGDEGTGDECPGDEGTGDKRVGDKGTGDESTGDTGSSDEHTGDRGAGNIGSSAGDTGFREE